MQQKSSIDLHADFDEVIPMNRAEVISVGLALLADVCHHNSYNRGWWHDPVSGLSLIPGDPEITSATIGKFIGAWFPYVIATKIALIHSEVSEGLEAYRVGATDDKIPFPGITAEMGDAVIRIADLMGCLKEYQLARLRGMPVPYDEKPSPVDYDLGAAILAKLPVNVGRVDHGLEARRKPGGKKF